MDLAIIRICSYRIWNHWVAQLATYMYVCHMIRFYVAWDYIRTITWNLMLVEMSCVYVILQCIQKLRSYPCTYIRMSFKQYAGTYICILLIDLFNNNTITLDFLTYCMTFDQFITIYYSGLTLVDYGEYFKLTVDSYFDRGCSSEYRMCWSATPSRGPTRFQILSMVSLYHKSWKSLLIP